MKIKGVPQVAQKTLNPKQKKALELLTCGEGLTYDEISKQVGINRKTLYDWRHEPQYTLFQEELNKIENERWMATVDIARKAAAKLCAEGNQKMVEFVLKNEGYNPTQKVEAEINTDINITIEE